MATLSANSKRVFEFNEDQLLQDIPVVASDIIYEGAAVGLSAGYARPLQAGDVFVGFATAKADNSSGSAGDKYVRVLQRGTVKLTIAGTLAVTDLAATVYASDDDTFTKSSTSNSDIGTLTRFISTTVGMVRFEGEQVRSLAI